MPLIKLTDFQSPTAPEAVVALLKRYQDSAVVVAGGTFIHGLVARGLLTDAEVLIDISQVGLSTVETNKSKVRIGATATLAQIERTESVCSTPLFGAMADALTYPPVQVKNAATLGGSIAASCPFFDLPVSMLALDTTVEVLGPTGYREISLERFSVSLFQNALEKGEFVAHLVVPIPTIPTASAFEKIETNANDLAILNAAARLSLENHVCRDARIFLGGGVGETPVRAPTVEGLLNGQPIDDGLIARAAEATRSEITPLTDHRASASYRRAMACVLVKRALHHAMDRIQALELRS